MKTKIKQLLNGADNIETQMFKIRNNTSSYLLREKASWFRTLGFWSFEFGPKIELIFILRGAQNGHEGLF